jgi:hypothetical protein
LRYSLVRTPLDGSSTTPAKAESGGKGAALEGALVLVVPD